MSTAARVRIAGAGLLVAGVFVGAVGAQVVQALVPSFFNTGLFTVRSGEDAKIFVSLDDAKGADPADVLVQLVNEAGGVALQQNVRLSPGKSTMVIMSTPGRYRVHGRVLDAPRLIGVRRAVVTTVEIGSDDFFFPIRPVCSIDESHTSGRPG